MAKLRVTLHGQMLAELILQPGQEYIAGRGSQCHILLANERGISRQHLKINEQNGAWVVQLTSKYGGIVHEGQTVESMSLQGEIQFSVPPYQFHFSEDSGAEAQVAAPEVLDAQPMPTDDIETPAAQSTPTPFATTPAAAAPEEELAVENSKGNIQEAAMAPAGEYNDDATAVGSSNLVAYLKIINNKTKTEDILKLEGQVWSAGRQPSCEIVINDSAISRKHFDLTNNGGSYYVTDHGSSNGTSVNGEKIAPSKPIRILSGDVITVRHIEIIFEIHDGEYKNKLQVAPQFNDPDFSSDFADGDAASEMEDDYAQNAMMPYEGAQGGMPAVLKIPPSMGGGGAPGSSGGFKPNKIQIIIGILALVMVYGLFSGPSTPPPTQDPGQANLGSDANQSPKELSPEKQKEVKDIFNLAHGYYLQRKYSLCLSSLEKLHNAVPFYSNSKEVENLCRQAQELENIRLDQQRKEEARAEAENKIRNNVEECTRKFNPKMTSAEMTACLSVAMELDPQNQQVTDLMLKVQAQEDAKQSAAEKQADFQRRRSAGQAVFNQAVAEYKSGQLKKALATFRRYLSGSYPGLNQADDEASRNIASIQKTLDESLSEAVSKCQSSMDRGDLAGAFNACSKVLRENPGNAKATEVKNKAFRQLQKDMKPLYEDGALEESLGNIEAAKEKWLKIVSTSVPADDYYKKAKQKLKKYGAN